MDGVCPLCVIDNTSVMLAAGAGAQALFAPEMVAFARTLLAPVGFFLGKQAADQFGRG
jgi:hypothetical protein